jgi:hypothetical protein
VKTPLKAALLGVSATVVLLLAGILLTPWLLKDQVIELVERQISERLYGTVAFEDVDLSLLSTFPALTIEVVGLSVVGAGEFEGVPLASVQSLRVGVDLRRLVRDDQLLIESAAVDRPEIRLIVNEDEEANYDIIKATDGEEETEAEDEPEALRLRLQQLEVTGGRIEYDKPGAEVLLEGFEHRGSALVDGATYTVASSTTVESLTVRVRDVGYIRRASASVELGSVLHADEERLELERLQVVLNELTGEASGTIQWANDEVRMDLSLESGKGQSIRALVSAIPAAYSGDLSGLRASGTYALSAEVKGRVPSREGHAPPFSASLRVRNGKLQHADLPLPLHGIEVAAVFRHPGGHLDEMAVDIRRLEVRAGEGHIEGRLSISKPLSRLFLEAALNGRMDLAELSQAYPLSDDAELQGKVGFELDLAAKGDRVHRLTGWMTATAVAYLPENAPHVRVSAASLSFAPKATKVDSLFATYGRSDLRVTGTLSPLTTMLRRDRPVVGNLPLDSRFFDLDEFLEGDSVEIPPNLDISIPAKAKKLLYKKLAFPDMRAVVLIKDGEVSLNDVRSDSGRQHAEALLSALKDEAILVPPAGRPDLVLPLKMR